MLAAALFWQKTRPCCYLGHQKFGGLFSSGELTRTQRRLLRRERQRRVKLALPQWSFRSLAKCSKRSKKSHLTSHTFRRFIIQIIQRGPWLPARFDPPLGRSAWSPPSPKFRGLRISSLP